MARPAVRIQVVQFGVLVSLALLVGRAAQVQILHGRRWAEEAKARRTERIVLQARRGTLYDRHGTPLAVTQETYHVGIAPNELRDPTADGALISRRLGLTARAWQLALRRRYAYFAGPYSALEVQPLRSVRGVHLEPVLNRFYPDPAVARATIGRLGDDGLGASGLERTLDSLLAGRAGAAVVLKDRAGREYESPARVIAPPVPGLDVVLTLDAELQEIAQRALDDALRRMDADGGDVVMLDPGTGDVLALASRQRDGSARPSAFTDTFEPGSLAKIFAAAALLSLRRVSPTDRVSGEGGKWRVLGRTITDDDPQPSLTMADAIRVSSNIAIAKFAARLTPEEQYAMLRDFGFGALTGIEFPAEATGRLRPPSEWTRPSAASLAMGYELSVTPIQVAMAYGALANDGLLLQPTLIREVRDASGGVRYRHRPEPVRRVVARDVAAALRNLLRGVVERGTGTEAALTNFPVAAKTGTARASACGRPCARSTGAGSAWRSGAGVSRSTPGRRRATARPPARWSRCSPTRTPPPGSAPVARLLRAAGRGDEQASGSRRRARAGAAPRRTARPAHLARDHRPHRRQPEGGARNAVLRGVRVRARRARVRDGGARARRRGGAGRARAGGGRAADPGARRSARRRRRRGGVVRPPRGEARSDRRHRDERQDDLGHAAAACPVGARADGLDRHAGRVRSGGRTRAERGRQPHHPRAHRSPGDARRAGRAGRARRGDGGLLPQPRSGPGGRTRVPRSPLHQPDARSPRLPQDPRGLFPRQGEARAVPGPRRARGGERRRSRVAEAAARAPPRDVRRAGGRGDRAARRSRRLRRPLRARHPHGRCGGTAPAARPLQRGQRPRRGGVRLGARRPGRDRRRAVDGCAAGTRSDGAHRRAAVHRAA